MSGEEKWEIYNKKFWKFNMAYLLHYGLETRKHNHHSAKFRVLLSVKVNFCGTEEILFFDLALRDVKKKTNNYLWVQLNHSYLYSIYMKNILYTVMS